MKEIISSIQENLAKIDAGNITMTEIEQLVSDSRELNERLIVLRYKVYEQGVLGYDTTYESELSSDEFANEEAQNENIRFEDTSIAIETQETEVPVNTFEIPFELNLFSDSSTIEEPQIELNQIEETIIEDNTHIQSIIDEENGIEEQIITHEQTSIIEEEDVSIVIETQEVTTITTYNDTEQAESIHMEEEIDPVSEQQSNSTLNSNSETINKLQSIEQNLRSNYSIMPLDTLVGSFTLNERLQFINELFEGSSDAFSTAVKKLDSQSNLISARAQVAEFAENNTWDLESEIVEDFLVKICRRYAADLSA
jgi:hypothetical protein